MVSRLLYCHDAAADGSGAGWKVQHLHLSGSDRQIELLGPDVFHVVSDVLEIFRDIIIIISVRLVDV